MNTRANNELRSFRKIVYCQRAPRGKRQFRDHLPSSYPENESSRFSIVILYFDAEPGRLLILMKYHCEQIAPPMYLFYSSRDAGTRFYSVSVGVYDTVDYNRIRTSSMGRGVLTTIIRVQDKYINSHIVPARNMGDNLRRAADS